MSQMEKLIKSGLSAEKAAELIVRSHTTAAPVPPPSSFTDAAKVAHKKVTENADD